MKAFFTKAWAWILVHKVISIAVAAVVVIGATLGIVLPIALHDHDFATEWSSDAENHWHAATCKHEEEVADKAAHTYDNACDPSCNVCAHTRAVVHHYTVEAANSETLKQAPTSTAKAQYWKSCTCGKVSTTEYFESDKTVATIADIQNLSKTYDGAAPANPTYITSSDGAVTFEWYQGETKLNAKPVNAGAYKVKVIIAETAAFAGVSATKDFTIFKATPALTNLALTPVEIKYGDSYLMNYGLNTGAGTVTVEYKVKTAADNTYTTTAPTAVGAYTARVTVAASDNYLGTSATVDFEIGTRALGNFNTNVIYNGTNVYDIDLSDAGYDNVVLRVTFASKNVGATVSEVVALENGEPTLNYTVDASTCNVDIVAKSVQVVWTAPASLYFDGNEKTPTAELTGVLAGDECTAQILKKDGDNVWFDELFTFEAMSLDGADAGNYALPLNGNTCTSPEYRITIDAMTVGTPSYIANGAYYQKIVIETAGYYYFDFVPATQGVEITFTLFKKGATLTTIPVFTVGDEGAQSAAFELEAGTYYVKSATEDEPQYDTLAIVADTHTAADAHGFCNKGCGTYVGEELTTNSWTTVTIPRGKSVYYRFEGHSNFNYNFGYYDSDGTNLTVTCYRMNDQGEPEELTGFGLLPHSFAASEDGYYYLVIKHNNALGGSSEKTITFQVEETNI